VEDPHLRDALRDHILGVHLKDNVKTRRLLSDGSYEQVHPQDGEPKLNSQEWLIEHRGIWHSEE
jgi:polyphosphate kinase